MKYIAKNIVAGFKNNLVFIILLLTIQVVSVWIFLYSFGMFSSYIDPNSVYSIFLKKFKISFITENPKGKVDKSKCITVGEFRSRLSELKEKLGEDFYKITLECMSDEHRTEDGYYIPLRSQVMSRESHQHDVAKGYCALESYESFISESSYVTADARLKGAIGDKLVIKGKRFNVEYGAEYADVYFHFASIPDEVLIYEMEISPPDIPNRKKSIQLHAMISEFFGLSGDAVKKPKSIDRYFEGDEQERKSYILLYALISILIQANLQLIFIHLILKRDKGREAFILSGCSILEFRMVVLGEVLLLFAAGVILGWISFKRLLLGVIISRTYGLKDFQILLDSKLFTYGFRCYIAVAVGFSIISVIANIRGGGKQIQLRNKGVD